MPTLEPALYLVPVPIGNRDDITLRALNVLRDADLIASEDTRTTAHLLGLYEISQKRLVAYHDHNEHERAAELVGLIQQGRSVALVSEAGSPCVSDPGFRLVREAVARGVKVVPLPGATAFVPALTASGFAVNAFTFVGFPPHKKGRQTFVKQLVQREETSIVYESSHRIVKFLEELCAAEAAQRQVCVARELTKLYEEFLRGTAQEVLHVLQQRTSQKGEFVVVIEGRTKGNVEKEREKRRENEYEYEDDAPDA
jgi:16S rRNA (cytidine1402-2'-O)-methyltransferase